MCVDLGILVAEIQIPPAFIFHICGVDNVLVSHSEPSQNMCRV